MTILRSLTTLAAVGCCALATSCAGYRLGADKPTKLAHVKNLAIPVFKNETLEPRSSVLVTNNTIRQFQNDTTYKISTVQNADAILRGTIARIERRQLRGTRFNALESRELEIRLWVNYTVEDARTHATLLKGSVSGYTSVFLDPKFQLTERQALDEASRRCAEDIFARVAEGW